LIESLSFWTKWTIVCANFHFNEIMQPQQNSESNEWAYTIGTDTMTYCARYRVSPEGNYQT